MSNIYSDLIGVPFKEDGRDTNGIDCYGLVKLINKRCGINLPELNYTFKREDIDNTVQDNEPLFKKLDKPEPFCMVTFSLFPPFVTHVGIVLEDCNKFIHVLKKTHVVIEKLNSPIWEKKIRGFYKYE